jgi:hypothetical protein
MIPKKPAPHLMRGGNRFSEKIMLKQRARGGMMKNHPASSIFLNAATVFGCKAAVLPQTRV